VGLAQTPNPAAQVEDLVLPGSSWGPIARLPLLNAGIPPGHRRLRPFDHSAFKRFSGRGITIIPYDLTPILLPGRISEISQEAQRLTDDIRLDLSNSVFPFHAAYPVYVPFWLAELEELSGEGHRITGVMLGVRVEGTTGQNVSDRSFSPSQPRRRQPLLLERAN
jgi:hypothetical protein